jgi:hypothetical protein
VWITGAGVCAGERIRPDGTKTSVLRFSSSQRLSLIRSGTGYWRYVPAADAGTRFLTGYDYEPGWGWFGELADRLVRPVMGWATAWSFDRLRLWLEDGIQPERSLRRWVLVTGLRAVVCAAAWLLTQELLAILLTLAIIWLPAPRSVPSARRCLRRPPDWLSGTYPAGPPPLAPPGQLLPGQP